MRKNALYIISLFLIFTTVAFIVFLGQNPVLYSLANENPSTRFHSDPEAIERLPINSSTDISPLMQEMLDFSGSIALNIRKENLDSAGRDLDQYYQKYYRFDKLVINLQMNESEIKDFQLNATLQGELFEQFKNSSESLNTLKKLEFRYRDQNDISSLTTVAFQGEALKKKLKTIQGEYNTVSENLIYQGEKYDLDTSELEQARKDINQYVDEFENKPENQLIGLENESSKNQISFLISPNSGIYGDEIHFSGFIAGSNTSFKDVDIYMDNQKEWSVLTSDIGDFSDFQPIEHINPGTHIITARWDTVLSSPQSLTVFTSNSTIDLWIKAIDNEPVILFFGKLVANDGVKDAPVHPIVNNISLNETFTNNEGNYSRFITLPQGKFQIYADFNDTSYPLNNSKSQKYEVISSGNDILSIRLLDENDYNIIFNFFIVGILGLFITLFGYYFFIRKNKKQFTFQKIFKNKKVISKSIDSLENSHEIVINSSDVRLVTQYKTWILENGISESARKIYLIILYKITQQFPITHSESLTIRELSEKIISKSYYENFVSFARFYEYIRYKGKQKEEDLDLFEKQMDELDLALREDKNEQE